MEKLYLLVKRRLDGELRNRKGSNDLLDREGKELFVDYEKINLVLKV